jgi:hypothetical protein
MTTKEYTLIENFEVREIPVLTIEAQEKPKKPGVVKAASIMMYIMAGLFVFAVLAGKPAAAVFIPLVVYLAYGLSSLKASARTGTIAFACFELLINLGAYVSSKFVMHGVLIDVVFYVAVLALLLSPSARNANWIRKSAA